MSEYEKVQPGARDYIAQGYSEIPDNDLFKLAFGYVGIPYLDTKLGNFAPFIRLGKTNLDGQPIMMPLKLNDYEFPMEPTITIRGSKKIIKSEIDGRAGTFKEAFRKGDYKITIDGLLINVDDEDEYPEELVRAFREAIDVPMKSLQIKEAPVLLDIYKIEYLAIESHELLPKVAFPNIQPFRITAISDMLATAELEVQKKDLENG